MIFPSPTKSCLGEDCWTGFIGGGIMESVDEALLGNRHVVIHGRWWSASINFGTTMRFEEK